MNRYVDWLGGGGKGREGERERERGGERERFCGSKQTNNLLRTSGREIEIHAQHFTNLLACACVWVMRAQECVRVPVDYVGGGGGGGGVAVDKSFSWCILHTLAGTTLLARFPVALRLQFQPAQ